MQLRVSALRVVGLGGGRVGKLRFAYLSLLYTSFPCLFWGRRGETKREREREREREINKKREREIERDRERERGGGQCTVGLSRSRRG